MRSHLLRRVPVEPHAPPRDRPPFPSVPLDDAGLAVLSIGIPVGLGVFLAWVNRNLQGRARAIGFVTSLGAALAGGWLGFHAGTGLLAVITTIVGAAAGANLGVLTLDLVWGRQVRDWGWVLPATSAGQSGCAANCFAETLASMHTVAPGLSRRRAIAAGSKLR
jgi:hypothetical protein